MRPICKNNIATLHRIALECGRSAILTEGFMALGRPNAKPPANDGRPVAAFL